jgi:hypothetical protein
MYRFPYFHTTLFSIIFSVLAIMLGIQSNSSTPLSHRILPTTINQNNLFMVNGTIAQESMGYNIALSADGSIVAIGETGYNNQKGRVLIYAQVDGEWTFKQALSGNDTSGATVTQGRRVTISDDGNTIIYSGIYDANQIGAIWVFVRNGDVWYQQCPKITSGAFSGVTQFQGYSLSSSNDGSTLAFGSLTEGIVVIYQRTGDVWNHIETILTGSVNCGVDLAMTTTTLLVSCSPGDYVLYYVSGGGWNLVQTITGVGVEGEPPAYFGSSVSLNDDVLAIGASDDDDDYHGAVFMFDQLPNGEWVQNGDKLTTTGCEGMGASVDLSPNGDKMIVGCPYADNYVGAYLYYIRLQDGSWYNVGGKQTAPGYIGESNQGLSVAITDGVYALGAPMDDSHRGKVWVFTI